MVSYPMAMSTKVLFVIAEMVPLVKVGGLADIGGSLPRALRGIGLDARVALPYYANIDGEALALRRLDSLPEGAAVWQGEARGVPVYLIEHAPSFGREEVYGYDDDAARFLSFCDGLLAAAEPLASAEPAEAGWKPDILHLHDWHPGFLASRLQGQPEHPWAGVPRVSTIHNLVFTGPFDRAFAEEHGLPERALEPPPGLAAELPFSALAQGILHADLVSTVSPTYAREILTPEVGGALSPLLERLGDRLCGILHGIDVKEYDPTTDPHLAARFGAEHIEGRVENKRALQRRLGLPVDGEVALLGMVSRLFWQKGSDLAVAAVERLLAGQQQDDTSAGRLQFVVLGQGDEEHERPLLELAERWPQHVAVRIEFNHELAQLIYGGCDLFVMPSRYEPCGLGQLIAMRYGAVPVVRRTGGLADSVAPYDGAEQGTGFVFDEASPEALTAALEQALATYREGTAWRSLQRRGMAQDVSWARAAAQYDDLYRRIVRARAGRPAGEAR